MPPHRRQKSLYGGFVCVAGTTAGGKTGGEQTIYCLLHKSELEGQKPVYKGIALVCHHIGHPDNAFALSGRRLPAYYTQGDALGSLPLQGVQQRFKD